MDMVITLEEIRDNQEIKKNLRWDLTPEKVFARPGRFRSKEDLNRIIKEHESMAGYYFYIHVWDFQAKLALMHIRPNGSGTSQVLETSEEFKDAFIEAIQDHGGAINRSGHYPINKRVRDMIQFFIGF